MSTHDLRYPIGLFEAPAHIDMAQRTHFIQSIQSLPRRLKTEVSSLNNDRLDTPYRDGGWTVRQVVHHCADSHMNSFIRFKWALTEDNPTIKPYDEGLWAALPDTASCNIEYSLILLEGLHARWTVLLNALQSDDLKRTFMHPQNGKEISLEACIALYAWHGDHHLAHIRSLKQRNNWL